MKMNKLKYDVTVVGAGAAGIACAYTCAKNGLKTLLIEKNIHAGGLITSGLVMPVMKLNDCGINNSFYRILTDTASKNECSITYSDGNKGWFNVEKLKFLFDTLLKSVDCDILYDSYVKNVTTKNHEFYLDVEQDILSVYIDTTFLVDATGNGKIFRELNLEILNDNSNSQAKSLRFLMSNVDVKKFANWISKIDEDKNVTTVCDVGEETHCSTAYTWDTGKNWALSPIFTKAVNDGILKPSDTAYFQVFTVPKMPSTIAFNCPRLLPDNTSNNTNSVFSDSELLIQGRERIIRLEKFCKKYLKGFENAYISNIADMLGTRESIRVKGKKIFTVDDIVTGRKPQNIALASDYPIDVHSNSPKSDKLEFTKHVWYLPLECLMSDRYDNLFVVGRCLSAEFLAQAAVRTQANCFSMGEAVANFITLKRNLK